MYKSIAFLLALATLLLSAAACRPDQGEKVVETVKDMENPEKVEVNLVAKENKKIIYLAGGCFWGLEGYFQKIPGVLETEVGYANGKTDHTDYAKVDLTDHAETVRLTYDISRISLAEILLRYFKVIDPTSVDRQGNDVGRQYRTGIYYTDDEDSQIIHKVMAYEKEIYGRVAVEVDRLHNYVRGEDYHQDYLKKNPGGYCHINLAKAQEPLFTENYAVPGEDEIKESLDSEAYKVMRQAGTERPGSSPLTDEYRKGIYVDKITGEPLFSSSDKFASGCGWPSFSRPITTDRLHELEDDSFGMVRTEVKTNKSNSHLGHVFADGPREKGGLRYCINGAALRFVPYEEMDSQGYAEYKVFCQ